MSFALPFTLAALLAALLSCHAVSPGDDAPSAERAPVVADLAWLTGYWSVTDDGRTTEECWLPPRGGVLLGLNRTTDAEGRVRAFEYLRIEAREDGIYYVASPGGGATTDFRLTECSGTRAVFANPKHDFPKRLIYAREGDRLEARAVGDDDRGPRWVWTRVARLPHD